MTRQTAEGVGSCRSLLALARSHGRRGPHHRGRRRRRPPAAAPGRAGRLLLSRARKAEGGLTRRRRARRGSDTSQRLRAGRPTGPRRPRCPTRQPRPAPRARSPTSPGWRRRRSSSDSTPPRLVACVHSRTGRPGARPPRVGQVDRPAPSRSRASDGRDLVARVPRQPGVAHPVHRRVRRQPSASSRGGRLRPLQPDVAGCAGPAAPARPRTGRGRLRERSGGRQGPRPAARSAVTVAPSRTSECPARDLVTECTTTSAPRARGSQQRGGVRAVDDAAGPARGRRARDAASGP